MRKYLAAACGLALYTQLAQLLSVPGFHFDEAWQAVFAHRIASEPGFFPLAAMNSYTSPVPHYLLAVVFKLLSPSLTVLRGAYAAMNLGACALFATLLWRTGERLAVAWFVLIWALLPMSVHDHRFNVEMTGFYGLCLAIFCWGVAFWRTRPWASAILIIASIVLATYSHILFITVYIGGLAVLARSYPEDFRSGKARATAATLALLLVPSPVRMGIGLGKALPFVMALGLLSIVALASHKALWAKLPRISLRNFRWLTLLALPFSVSYLFLMWNGFWPYAQATGVLNSRWIPINLFIFLGLAGYQLRWVRISSWHSSTDRSERTPFRLSPSIIWNAFIASFALSSVLILKQSPRYYMIPTVFAMIWMSQRLARIRSARTQAALALAFLCPNLWAFHFSYLRQYDGHAPIDREFRLGPFHDNARDFRAFQRAQEWLVEQNCQRVLEWYEDDRFGMPMKFLALTAPEPKGECPWTKGNLFFSYIPNYDESFAGARDDSNTPPPWPNVKILAHRPEWGDLAFWIRR